MKSNKKNKIQIVDNEPKYWDFIRELRLMPGCREGFLTQGDITHEEHARFMQKNGANYKICFLNNKPVGFIGVVERDIRLAVHPHHQKEGIGLIMLNLFMKENPDGFAKISPINNASKRLFEKAGFKLKYLHYEKRK